MTHLKPFCIEVITSNAAKRVQEFVYSFGYKNDKNENKVVEFLPPNNFYFHFDGNTLRTTYEPIQEITITYHEFLEMVQNLEPNLLTEKSKLVKISESPFRNYVILNDNPDSELFDNSFRLNPAYNWKIITIEGTPHLVPIIKSI
jgi:hypothetical protein